jgi:hypothetical protein
MAPPPYPSRRLFRDDGLEREFARRGFVVVPFLSPEEVSGFYDWYVEKRRRDEVNAPGAYNAQWAEFSIIHSREDFRREVFGKITGAFAARTAELLDRYRPLIANYILKEPGGKGAVPVHQNWSVVDESRYASVSIWCPLVDTTIENGTLQMVEGSHRMFRGQRGSWGSHNFHDVEPLILDRFLTPVPVRAGEAIVLDDSIIHFSTLNRSPEIRLALQLIMIPEEAEALYFYRDPARADGRVQRFEVGPEYFFRFENWLGNPEKARLLDEIEVETPNYTESEFLDLYLGRGPAPPPSLLGRLAAWLR